MNMFCSSLILEPKAIAAIFLKRKPVPHKPDTTEENEVTTDGPVPSLSAVCPANNLASTANRTKGSAVELLWPIEKTVAEKEAANKAFKALFTGASSQKSIAPAASVAEALPAPWPSVSHVFQKDDDTSTDVNFWCLPWPAEKAFNLNVQESSSSLDGKYCQCN